MARKTRSKPRTTRAKPRTIEELVAAYRAWVEKQGSPELIALEGPAKPAALKKLGKVPADLHKLMALCDGGMHFFEYTLLSCEGIARRRKGLEKLRKDGTFDSHEIFASDANIVRRVKWHPKWLPLFEDGGGNLYFMDLAPDKNGRVGQIIQWEVAGGPGARKSLLLREFLENYVQLLESNKLKYDDTFGIADVGNRSERAYFV